jgi:hypothetical protein
MKSTNDVLDHHLRAIEQGDVNAVLSDYAPDAVLFRSDGVFKGVAAIKPVFDSFVAEFRLQEQQPPRSSDWSSAIMAICCGRARLPTTFMNWLPIRSS